MSSKNNFIDGIWEKYEQYNISEKKDKFYKKHVYKNTDRFRTIRTLFSWMIVLVTTIGVAYAVTEGTIEGIPAVDWLGLKFSNKYVEYKKLVENQVVAFDNTVVELSSTLCNEGITVLEFNLKLSEEDYKKLKINESAATEEFLSSMEERKNDLRKKVELDLRGEKYYEENRKGNFNIKLDDVEVSEDEINAKYDEELLKLENQITERKQTKFIPALSLNYDQIGGTYNYDKFNPNTEWFASIYIDDVPYYITNWQKTEKISDYEYKIYTMYFISDEILNGKDNFKITLKNNKLVGHINWNNGWTAHCQSFANDRDNIILMTPPISIIDLPGNFEVNVSKNDILKDSTVIDNPDIKSEFRNITQTVEKVVISPVQTIIKIKHSATEQSSKAFANRYPGKPQIEHLPVTREYKVYDANGNELNCLGNSNKRTLIYSDGTREDYDTHDLPNKKFNNATWEEITYLLVENVDTEYIKIVPIENIHNPVKGADGEIIAEDTYEMEPLIIKLK